MKNHFIGAILLIAGTTLGVGMLAFPTVTSFSGFVPSAFLFLVLWLLMLATAFFFLDANLSVKGENNMVTMAEKRLGTWGKILSWVVYLLLLYSLTAAYIAGCTPLFVEAIQKLTGYTLPNWFAPFSLPILFGGFVYSGTKRVDQINRLLMIGLVLSFAFLIFFLPQEVDIDKLSYMNFPMLGIAIPVVITAFGYHIIIPTLTTYLKRDKALLRKAILIGSTIPIVAYLLWQILVLGSVPSEMLAEAYQKGFAATEPLARILMNPWLSLAVKLFTFFAIVTSFVGVTLSLSDFLTDGFKIKRTHMGRVIAILLTFIPPLFFVFSYPKGFYLALNYAGAFVAILLVFLPAAMVWKLPKYKNFSKKIFLSLVIFLAISIVILDVLEERGKLQARKKTQTSQE